MERPSSDTDEDWKERVLDSTKQLERRHSAGGSFWKHLRLLVGFGWLIAIPAVLGTFVGHSLAIAYAPERTLLWSVIGMLLGLVSGFWTAWRLVSEMLNGE